MVSALIGEHAASQAATSGTLARGPSRPATVNAYPAPLPHEDVHRAASLAVRRLASGRGLDWPTADGAARLHLLGSLILDLSLELEDAILTAADQRLSEADIGRLAGLTIREVRQVMEALAD